MKICCLNCNKEFLVVKTRINKSIKNGYLISFCSNFCRRTYWYVHKKSRKEILKKYNNLPKNIMHKRLWHEKKRFNGNCSIFGKSCYVCGSNIQLVIHHVDGNNGRFGKPVNNHKDNLMVLCRSCHPKLHNKWWLKIFKVNE